MKNSRYKKYHFVYKTTNVINGLFYIGVHSTNQLDDGYLGSGQILLKAIKKHGRNRFKRAILKMFDSRVEAYDYESLLVTETLIKSRTCYNRAVGGSGGYLGELAVKKMRRTKKGSVPWNKGSGAPRVCIKCRGATVNLYATHCRQCYASGIYAGKNNPAWRYLYVIKDKQYYSLKNAELETGIPSTTLRRYCENPLKLDFHKSCKQAGIR